MLKTIKYDLLEDRKAEDFYKYDDYGNLIRVRKQHVQGSIGKNQSFEYEKIEKEE